MNELFILAAVEGWAQKNPPLFFHSKGEKEMKPILVPQGSVLPVKIGAIDPLRIPAPMPPFEKPVKFMSSKNNVKLEKSPDGLGVFIEAMMPGLTRITATWKFKDHKLSRRSFRIQVIREVKTRILRGRRRR